MALTNVVNVGGFGIENVQIMHKMKKGRMCALFYAPPSGLEPETP
jgi:hypothetical protein